MKNLAPRPLLAMGIILSMSLGLFQGRAALADERTEANQLVEKAQLTLHNVTCDDNMGALRALMPKAEGVLIAPELLKGAFVFGASGGNAVLLVRDKASGTWSEPAFYTIAGGSIGWQVGGQSSEVIFLAMTDRGVKSFLNNSFKLGGDLAVAAGPVGMGASAATANLSADILSFSRAKGLYGGISVDGAVVAVRDSLNRAYYGKEMSTTDILIKQAAMNPQGATLAKAVEDSASGDPNKHNCTVTPSRADEAQDDRVSGL